MVCFSFKVLDIFMFKIRKKEFVFCNNISWYIFFFNIKIIIFMECILFVVWLFVVFGCGLGGWGDGWWLDDDECCGDFGDDLFVDRLLLDCCKMLEEFFSFSLWEVYCNLDFIFVGFCGFERLVFIFFFLIKFRVWL